MKYTKQKFEQLLETVNNTIKEEKQAVLHLIEQSKKLDEIISNRQYAESKEDLINVRNRMVSAINTVMTTTIDKEDAYTEMIEILL